MYHETNGPDLERPDLSERNMTSKLIAGARGIDRRRWLGAGACFFLINACGAKTMKVRFDVVLFNYLDRPIFEVLIDGNVDASSDQYPGTGSGTIMGIQLAPGPKKVTWRLGGPEGLANNGDTVTSKNTPELKPIPGGRYLGIHIYPDYSVELIPTVSFPRVSERGESEMSKAGRDRG
jgi:hypothetical protein